MADIEETYETENYETEVPDFNPDPQYDEETQRLIDDNPEFAEAIRKAQLGVYDSTLFQMWKEGLENLIEGTRGVLSINTADALLRAWPWLKYHDLESYLENRARYLEEGHKVLLDVLGSDIEDIFAEAKDDWKLHKELYIDVIVRWSAMTNNWARAWTRLPIRGATKGVMHAVIADVTSIFVGPNGYVENVRNLAGFEITEEEGKDIEDRVILLTETV